MSLGYADGILIKRVSNLLILMGSVVSNLRHRVFVFSFRFNEKGAEGIVNPHLPVFRAVARPT